ncbi:unnamed protein product [Thelazia callipaeda]|uniref:Coiled-coil domain-containing protein 94 n=1 Tax=Thelazia callipaeda TaxID=103827 RepID=A0A0N5CND5_THECL|nr:unnamed protein product [Thelazia callipaeda]
MRSQICKLMIDDLNGIKLCAEIFALNSEILQILKQVSNKKFQKKCEETNEKQSVIVVEKNPQAPMSLVVKDLNHSAKSRTTISSSKLQLHGADSRISQPLSDPNPRTVPSDQSHEKPLKSAEQILKIESTLHDEERKSKKDEQDKKLPEEQLQLMDEALAEKTSHSLEEKSDHSITGVSDEEESVSDEEEIP